MFKAIYRDHYIFIKKAKPHKSHTELKLGASFLTGLIGASIANNLIIIAYHYEYLSVLSKTDWTIGLLIGVSPFCAYFYYRSDAYCEGIEEHKLSYERIAYFIFFCLLGCVVSTPFL